MMLMTVSSFRLNPNKFVGNVRARSVASYAATGPRPIHKEFTVEKGTPEKKELLNVVSWPTWSTAGIFIIISSSSSLSHHYYY